MDKELIVSRYQEPVDWVLSSPIPVSLYNHGEPLDFDHPNVDVIDLPNQGREAGCYLEHLVRNYDNLSQQSFFVQADPHQTVAELFRRLEVFYTDTTPLTKEYLPFYPSNEAKAKDRVEWFDGGVEVHWGLADPVEANRCDACSSPCDLLWRQFFAGPKPDPFWFGYGASYAVPRHRITGRSKAYWLWVRDLVNKSDNSTHVGITNAWSLELLWNYLWGDSDLYPVHGQVEEKHTPLELAARFAKAAATQALAGNPQCSQDEQDKRKAICSLCPLYDAVRDKCNKCGCSDMELKRRWLTSKCPVSLW